MENINVNFQEFSKCIKSDNITKTIFILIALPRLLSFYNLPKNFGERIEYNFLWAILRNKCRVYTNIPADGFFFISGIPGSNGGVGGNSNSKRQY